MVTSPSFLEHRVGTPERALEIAGTLGVWLLRLGVLVAAASLLAWGGLFFYTRSLEGRVTELSGAVSRRVQELDTPALAELVGLASALSEARELLAGHAFPTELFRFLEETTLPTVGYASFGFARDTRKIELSGQARSYQSVADQVRVLEARGDVESVTFGGLSLGPRGLVNFKLTIVVKPGLLTTFR